MTRPRPASEAQAAQREWDAGDHLGSVGVHVEEPAQICPQTCIMAFCEGSNQLTPHKVESLNADAQWRRRTHAECKSGTSGMRSSSVRRLRRLSCKCAATKSSWPRGVPNTRMPIALILSRHGPQDLLLGQSAPTCHKILVALHQNSTPGSCLR